MRIVNSRAAIQLLCVGDLELLTFCAAAIIACSRPEAARDRTAGENCV